MSVENKKQLAEAFLAEASKTMYPGTPANNTVISGAYEPGEYTSTKTGKVTRYLSRQGSPRIPLNDSLLGYLKVNEQGLIEPTKDLKVVWGDSIKIEGVATPIQQWSVK